MAESLQTDRWQRVQDLFTQAGALPTHERAEFLAEVCGDDAELRREVESLLAHDARATPDFLSPPPPPPEVRGDPPAAGPDPLIGQRISQYEIKAVIAAGGMGTVYEAVQEHPHRSVALKLMNQRVCAPSALRRFQCEAEILGRLRHPNIAQVYQAGVYTEGPAAVPYFAMEYIPDARSIMQYAIEKKPDTRQRLELFAKVCDAVHHGHQKGIIHRDLKPGNILVDAGGEPKVIDFGVARATDADLAVTTQQSSVGQLIGTVQYMSPEQCDADPHELDTRSDVYSLGVVLYELLTGELPYDASTGTLYAATRLIREHAPRPPSQVVASGLRTGRPDGWHGRPGRELRGDIDTIVLKALEKDRNRRYASAADLAQDIRRHLNGEPIEAHPPTAWTRAVRWAARHPLVVTAIACLAFATATVLATFAMVWVIKQHPWHVKVAEDGSEVRVETVSGRVLQRWRTDPGKPPFRFARLVDRPGQLGGGKLVLVGFPALSHPEYAGKLCAFNVAGDFSAPLWATGIADDDLPLEYAARGVGAEFSINEATVTDIFPEEPGLEVLAIFSHVWSRRCIRVYNLAGQVRYQVWHDGGLLMPYWISESRLLVFAGTDDRACREGAEMTSASRCPCVLFALRPQRGVRVTQYVLETGRAAEIGRAWCVRVEPGESLGNADVLAPTAPPPPYDPSRYVHWGIAFDAQRIQACGWVLDATGTVVAGPMATDHYRRNQQDYPPGDPRRLPDVSQVRFVPWHGPASEATGNSRGPSSTNPASP